MPSNLYGPGDNYTNPDHSHVIPALIHRFHHAKKSGDGKVKIWGSGTPLREFLFVDELAKACVHLLKNYEKPEFLNVGSGQEVSILELSRMIAKTVGFSGEIELDNTKPDGTPRKVLDSSKINEFGWQAQTDLIQGLELAYRDFLKNFS